MAADVQDKIVFGSFEMLRRRFGAAVITDEMTALQSLYMAEGEGQEFAMFKRQGVKSMGLDGMSFSFDGNNISPEVIALIESLENDSGDDGVLFGRLF